VSSYEFAPRLIESNPRTGLDSNRSSAFPCGIPSRMSTSTTSPSSFVAQPMATCSPTNPAPTTVIFFRMVLPGSTSEVGDDRRADLRALHFASALHLPREVVRHDLLVDRLRERRGHRLPRLLPSEVLEHHHTRDDERAGADLVETGVLRRRPVRRLEERDLVGHVRARRHTQAPD